MAQSPKDYKKNILFSVVEPIGRLFNNSDPPAPSKGTREHSSKSMGRKILRKIMTTSSSQSTLSLPLTLSTENPGGETSLGKYRIFSIQLLPPGRYASKR